MINVQAAVSAHIMYTVNMSSVVTDCHTICDAVIECMLNLYPRRYSTPVW